MRKYTITEKEIAWLTYQQITELLYYYNRQSTLLNLDVKICLSIGTRWREALNLNRSRVTKHRISFVMTKCKKDRSIPISKELYEETIALNDFRVSTACNFQFMSMMDKNSIVLPRGQ